MTVKCLIKSSEYHDSVSLMLVARDLVGLPGVADAAVVMGTEANKALLREAGLLTNEIGSASPNDLIIAVKAKASDAQSALVEAEKLLLKKASTAQDSEFRARSLRGAVKNQPEANLAVISVPGRYAAAEARQALQMGLHVLLFSDNVTLEDEIALKQKAVQAGLLLMGPGAGTAILNGVALGFANVLPPGPVGIVAAAGTGLQEVSCLLARYGVGITQGIGTGGRDLKAEVGGLMMLAGLRALQDDPSTQVIALVSKPPAESVTRQVLAQVAESPKPTVICFLGGDPGLSAHIPNARPARTLQECAWLAALAAGADLPDLDSMLADEANTSQTVAAGLRAQSKPEQRYLRGLYSGGTLCYEAQVIWQEILAEPVYSNAPLHEQDQLPDSTRSQGHSVIDLGEEEFTVGRPHPMIDNSLRIRRLLQEARDPQTAVILLDIVLGYGAHPDPASELAPTISQARQAAAQESRELVFIASVTGTAGDPQGYDRQVQVLKDAGVVICESNAAAARLAGKVGSGK